MSYGHFSQDGYEYIVTSPLTPRPWGNFLTNEGYGALVSSTGGGYSWFKDCKTERINNFIGRNLHTGKPGRYIYLRDADSGQAWSATFEPLRVKPDSFEARMGLGYTTIASKNFDIATEVTYFVPRQDSCECWIVNITNTGKTARKLNIFGYIEWFIGSTDYINFYNIAILWNRMDFDKETQSVQARKTAFYEEFNIKNNPYIAFISSSEKVDSWDAHKANFLGRLNTESEPQGVLNGQCTQSLCDGEEGVGVLQHNITLNPGETKTIVFTLGQAVGKEAAAELIKKYRNVATAKNELEDVKKFWKGTIDNVWMETPDADFNQMMNIWVKFQLQMCNRWSRSPSFFHEGQGGRGYRDSCQDAEGIMSMNAEYAKQKLRKIASLIRRDGTCAPGWSDTYGPFQNRPFKDHPTWLIPSIAAYIKETGDKDFLNEMIPWLKDKWREGGTKVDINWNHGAITDGEGTLFDHLMAQLNFSFHDVSVHGIPRVGEADWNDALDMAGRRQIGESVWLGMALVRSLKVLAELAHQIDRLDIAADLKHKAKTMTDRINEAGWDGEWYIAGYNDDLVPFGSSKNKEGKIFLNSQSWAILSGVVTPERLPTILNSVEKHLDGKHGMALLAPAYTVFDPGLGRIAMFTRGTKENAAVFCHAQTFMIAALCQIGLGDKAYQALNQIMPSKQKDIELYKTEPYVYAEYLNGPDHPYSYGEGAYTWLTGTAGWTFMVASEWILGARRDWNGLIVDPCLPSSWKSAKIKRPFRGATYDIAIENPNGAQKGVKEVYVDGQLFWSADKAKRAADGTPELPVIPPHSDGKVHPVRVVMGAASQLAAGLYEKSAVKK